jgi:hypothetical protein
MNYFDETFTERRKCKLTVTVLLLYMIWDKVSETDYSVLFIYIMSQKTTLSVDEILFSIW